MDDAADAEMRAMGRPHANADAAKKSCAPLLPATDCPVLIGIDAIAAWLGIGRGRCRGLVDSGVLPTFRLPGRSFRCALKTEIAEAMQQYAAKAKFPK